MLTGQHAGQLGFLCSHAVAVRHLHAHVCCPAVIANMRGKLTCWCCVFCMPLRVLLSCSHCQHARQQPRGGCGPADGTARPPGLARTYHQPRVWPRCVAAGVLCWLHARSTWRCCGTSLESCQREKGVKTTVATVLRSSCAWLRSGSLTERARLFAALGGFAAHH